MQQISTQWFVHTLKNVNIIVLSSKCETAIPYFAVYKSTRHFAVKKVQVLEFPCISRPRYCAI